MRLTDGVLSAVAVAAISVGYAILGLVILAPEGVYSGDIGVKFVQARALADSGFRSLDIPYPGEFLDSDREFFPLRAPFVMNAGGETQAIFSPVVALLQAPMTVLAGLRGLSLLSVIAGACVLLAVRALAPPDLKTAAVIAVGVASPLWSYAVIGFEHAPAVAFSTAAFAVAMSPPNRRTALTAGALFGAGALLRDEVLLLFPGLLWLFFRQTRTASPALLTVAGAAVVLLTGSAMDAFWFGRPPAAHLLHATDILGAADVEGSVPALVRLTLRERYEAVIQYWVLGYGNNFWIAVFASTFAAAWAVRWRWRSAAGTIPILMWLTAILVLALLDGWEVVTAPKWLAGLHRVAPYLVCALLPLPLMARRDSWPTTIVLVTSVVFVGIAFATTKTTGGKSLGPRLLLPLLPLLGVAALVRIAAYLKSAARVERAIGATGIMLVVTAAVIHLAGTVPAYRARNRDDSAAVLTALRDPARVVVADDMFTAQLLFPLYYRKIVLLADTRELRAGLGTRLADAKVPEVLLLSRRPEPGMRLSPLKIRQSDYVGRLHIQYWGRVGRDLK